MAVSSKQAPYSRAGKGTVRQPGSGHRHCPALAFRLSHRCCATEQYAERRMQSHSALQRHLDLVPVIRNGHPGLSCADVSEREDVQFLGFHVVVRPVSASWPALARLDDRHHLVVAAVAAIVHHLLAVIATVALVGAGFRQPVWARGLSVHSGLLSPRRSVRPGEQPHSPKSCRKASKIAEGEHRSHGSEHAAAEPRACPGSISQGTEARRPKSRTPPGSPPRYPPGLPRRSGPRSAPSASSGRPHGLRRGFRRSCRRGRRRSRPGCGRHTFPSAQTVGHRLASADGHSWCRDQPCRDCPPHH